MMIYHIKNFHHLNNWIFREAFLQKPTNHILWLITIHDIFVNESYRAENQEIIFLLY